MEMAVALMLAAAALLLARVARGGRLVLDFGGWGAPFGVTFVADGLSAALCTVTGIVALAVAVFARADIRARRRRAGFDPLFLAMLAAVNGAFLTGDIFNLYVWFELMLVTALGLVTLDRRRAQIDGAFRYASMSMMGATFMLLGIGLLYGETGTLDMGHLSTLLAGRHLPSRSAPRPICCWRVSRSRRDCSHSSSGCLRPTTRHRSACPPRSRGC